MNLYSRKQRWKIVFLAIAVLFIGCSLYFSNSIVYKISEREKERAQLWAKSIKKKAELVQLTNSAFAALRAKEHKEMELWSDAQTEIFKEEFSNLNVKIIGQNENIPVVLYDSKKNYLSAHRNIELDFNAVRKKYPELSFDELNQKYDDSIITIAKTWKHKLKFEITPSFQITCAYTDSREIVRLEHERDSLIHAFNEELTEKSNAIPALLIDKSSDSIIATNLPSHQLHDQTLFRTLEKLGKKNEPIEIVFNNKQNSLLYYDNSPELGLLQVYPYIQFLILVLLIVIAYLIFKTFKKAEQDQVWAGMAKETAHQLGTPLSSLIAWVEYLETQPIDASIPFEMKKDVQRLEQVTNRFSKIGSEIKLEHSNICDTVKRSMDYLTPRISNKIEFTFKSSSPTFLVSHNPSLIEWVIENICKNAIDAMENKGKLAISIHQEGAITYLDISDTGKGIEEQHIQSIFQPGFSTKKRGWGLGLSLVKRIIHDYHHGKISVLKTELNKGTTFRIELH